MKRSILFLGVLLASLYVVAQPKNSADIKLDISNSIQQKLEVYRYQNGDKILFKTVILGTKPHENIDITVPFEGNEQSMSLHFSVRGPGNKLILMPEERLIISTDLSDPNKIFGNTTYSGSKLTKEFLDFFEESVKLGSAYTLAKNNYTDALTGGRADTAILRHIRDSVNTLGKNHEKNLGLTTNSPAMLQYVLAGTGVYDFNFSPSEYESLKEKFKNDPYTLKLINSTENSTMPDNGISYEVNGVKRGSYLTDFTLPDRKGKLLSLSGFKGKYVLVDIWSSWCIPCRAEMPGLKEALQRFGKDNFMILSISIDENHDSWLKAIQKDGTNEFVHLIDDKGWRSEIVKMYQIKGIPSNFLIDPSGKVLAKDLRGSDVVTQLSDLYKAPH